MLSISPVWRIRSGGSGSSDRETNEGLKRLRVQEKWETAMGMGAQKR